MNEISLTSKKNLPDKAAIALLDRAKKSGYKGIGVVTYELVEDSGDGKIHKFTTNGVA